MMYIEQLHAEEVPPLATGGHISSRRTEYVSRASKKVFTFYELKFQEIQANCAWDMLA